MGLLTGMFRAATPENPRFSLNDPNAWDAFGVTPTSSGVPVSRLIALTHGPWWKGVNLLARDTGKLPLVVYRRIEKTDEEIGGKERYKEHPAYSLLRRKANEFQDALQFKMQLTAHALDSGNGYAAIIRLGNGAPSELIPLDPDATYPIREHRGGQSRIIYTTQIGNEMRKLPAEDVLHIKGLGFDGLVGYPCRMMAKEDIGLAIGQRKFSSVYFRNDATPAVVLEIPGNLTKESEIRLRESWERLHSGLDNKHRTAILTNGMKASKLSYTARESQLMESREFEAIEVSNFLGIPPHKLGVKSNTSYGSLEQENQAYLSEALDFWLCVWENECHCKLLTEKEQSDDSVIIEFVRQALVRADLTARANYYRAALGGRPWMVPNEARDIENLNPLEGWDEPLDPLNMGQGGINNEEPAAPMKPTPGKKSMPMDDGTESEPDDSTDAAIPPAVIEAAKVSVRDATARMVRRLANGAERAAKRPEAFIAWIEGIPSEHGEVIRQALGPCERLAEACGCVVLGFAGELMDGVAAMLLDFAGSVTAANLAEALPAEFPRIENAMVERATSFYFGEPACNTSES